MTQRADRPRPAGWRFTAAVLGVAFAAAANAQPARPPRPVVVPASIGHVRDIKQLGALQGCSQSSGGSAAAPGTVRVRRGRNVPPTAITRGDSVRLHDGLDVDASTDVMLRVESAELGRGTFYLAPRLFCGVRFGRDTVVARLTDDAPDAAFELAVDTTRPRPGQPAPNRPLEFAVERGAAIVQWNGGPNRPLIIRAAGQRIPVPGTDVAVVVDRTGDFALLYVRTGFVLFQQFAGLQARAGDMFYLRRGQTPRLLRAGADAIRSNLRYHTNSVWEGPGRPFWQRPGFYVPAGLVAAGGITWAVVGSGGSDDAPSSYSGTIRVRIPF